MWIDASGSASPANLVIWPGNGGANQQWCFMPAGYGAWYIYAYYSSGHYDCIDVTSANYNPGTHLLAYPCNWSNAEKWYACLRFGVPNYSFEPAAPPLSSVWMDVWGGPGSSAYVAGNPIQIWNGNGEDNQRFMLNPSPGEPWNLPYPATGGVADAFKGDLAPYKVSKGTIRLPLSEPVPVKLIAGIAKFRAKEGAERTKRKPKASKKRGL